MTASSTHPAMFRAKHRPRTGRRILLITPQLPFPPHQGTAIRNWHLLRHLAAHHTVDLLAFAADPTAALAAAAPLHDLCRRVAVLPEPPRPLRARLTDLLTGRPDMSRRLHSPAFAQHLTAWLGDGCDILQAEGIEMAPYLLQAAAPRRIYDAHNAEALLQQRNFLTDLRRPRRWVAAAYSLAQWRLLTRFESRVLRTADHVIAVSPHDRATLRALVPTADPLVIPNGVDTAYFDPALPDTSPTIALPPGQPSLVFTGKLDYRPNIEACEWLVHHVMPIVWSTSPATHLALVGRDPAPRVAALAGPRVTVTGWVPDTRPFMRAATVYVAPIRVGGGTRLKLLEALAMACATVSTTAAAEGLDPSAFVLADTPSAFAAAILQLLEHPNRRAELARSARHLAVSRYDWSALLPALDPLYAE